LIRNGKNVINKKMTPWSEEKIEELYFVIKYFAEKYLSPHGVKVPKLRKRGGGYVKDALTLVRLAENYPDTKEVTKSELTAFIRMYYPEVNDCQQARHLGAQKGFNIISSRRRERGIGTESKDSYKLVNLTQTHGYYSSNRRKSDLSSWDLIVYEYDFKCATCGSEEGKPERYNKEAIAKLQVSHMNPHLPLEQGNIIPQCSHCNQSLKNNWVFEPTGKPYAIANAKVIHNSSIKVQYEVYQELKQKFEL